MTAERRIDPLDFMRGIAVFSVVAFHTFGIFHADALIVKPAFYGFFGVQLFFVISAITMCTMWDRRSGEESPSLKFYIRRFCRIAGPFWVAIVFYLWFIPHDIPSRDAPDGVGISQIATSALLVHSLSPSWISAIVPGGWSIGVEVIFYAFFPLLVRCNGSPRFYLLIGLAIYLFNLCLVQPIGWRLLTGYDQGSAHDYMDRQIFNQGATFLIGMAAYKFASPLKWSDVAVPILWIFIAVAAKMLGLRGAAPTFWVAVFGMAVAVRLAVTYGISWRPLAMLGEVSYSVYLSHFAVLWTLSAAFIALDIPQRSVWSFYAALAIVTVASFAVGAVMRVLVERPSTEVGKWIIARGASTAQAVG